MACLAVLIHVHATIDMNCVACDVGGARGSQIHHRLGHVIRLPQSHRRDVIHRLCARPLGEARLHNIAGVLLRVIDQPYLIAVKLLAGRDKDMADINLLFQHSDQAGQLDQLVHDAGQILNSFCPELIEDFDSRCQAWQSGIGF